MPARKLMPRASVSAVTTIYVTGFSFVENAIPICETPGTVEDSLYCPDLPLVRGETTGGSVRGRRSVTFQDACAQRHVGDVHVRSLASRANTRESEHGIITPIIHRLAHKVDPNREGKAIDVSSLRIVTRLYGVGGNSSGSRAPCRMR